VDPTNPFFQSLGTNGRTCNTCHIQASSWSFTPADAQARFDASGGLDPLFAVVDGTNSPLADMSTLNARTAATTMIRERGVIRIGLPMPANADYTLISIQDPYGFASASQLSLFRRPIAAANVSFESGLMWDMRETTQPLLPSNTAAQNLAALHADLNKLSIDATLTHAQATTAPTQAQLDAISNLQETDFVAQIVDINASELDQAGATGGAVNLAGQSMFIGINDPFGQNPTGAQFNPASMSLFAAWTNLTGTDSVTLARQSVARGEAIFNSRPLTIQGVNGLNDVLGVQSFQGTCTTCHDIPNVGGHSISAALNTGVAVHRTLDQPLYTFQSNLTGATIALNDPGVGLITGKFTDLGKFHVPSLRGLAGRLPLFHDGSAHSIDGVLTFYKNRFGLVLSTQDETDLANFLETL
jgi:hypothetical protein